MWRNVARLALTEIKSNTTKSKCHQPLRREAGTGEKGWALLVPVLITVITTKFVYLVFLQIIQLVCLRHWVLYLIDGAGSISRRALHSLRSSPIFVLGLVVVPNKLIAFLKNFYSL